MMDHVAIVASWGRDWHAALPVRTAAEQAALLVETRQVVRALQMAAHTEGKVGHALHRKSILETADATFETSATIPKMLQLGPFTPNAVWPALLRLSNAFPVVRSDDVPDQRGMGVQVGDGEMRLDLLATTGAAHHARDARAMLASLRTAAAASRGGVAGRVVALTTLVRAIGIKDGLRMLRTISRAAKADVSLASLSFYSRAPFHLGDFAVRYRFAPIAGVDAAVRGTGPNALAADLRERLREGPLRWAFELQGYLNARDTPMDDHRVAWRSPWLPVASLALRGERTPSTSLELRAGATWSHATAAVLEPLGDLNMLRAAAYEVSQTERRRHS